VEREDLFIGPNGMPFSSVEIENPMMMAAYRARQAIRGVGQAVGSAQEAVAGTMQGIRQGIVQAARRGAQNALMSAGGMEAIPGIAAGLARTGLGAGVVAGTGLLAADIAYQTGYMDITGQPTHRSGPLFDFGEHILRARREAGNPPELQDMLQQRSGKPTPDHVHAMYGNSWR
jgi:hypothetical protein